MRKVWICLALLVVVPGLLFTASCAKKTVKADSSMTTQAAPQQEQAKQDEEAARKLKEAELAKQREMEAARQRALEEQRLREQRLRDERMKEEQRKAEMARKAAEAQKEAFLTELVLFDFDSSVLTPTAQERLRKKADWLKQNADVKIIIEGHCDERGTAEYNLALGERRAETAKAFLVDLGIPAHRMTTISYGEERPFATLHTEDAWAMNRRAHFVIE